MTLGAIPACIKLCIRSQGDANSFRVNKVSCCCFFLFSGSAFKQTAESPFLSLPLCTSLLQLAQGMGEVLQLCWKCCKKSIGGKLPERGVTQGSAGVPASGGWQEVLVTKFSSIDMSAGAAILCVCVDIQESCAAAESCSCVLSESPAGPSSSSVPPSTPSSVSKTILQ